MPRVLPYVLYTGAGPWTAATSLAGLIRAPEPPSAAARALAGLGAAHRYAVLGLQSASAQRHPAPTVDANVRELAAQVRRHGAEAGIGFDGV